MYSYIPLHFSLWWMILIQLASQRWRTAMRTKQLSTVANWPRHCSFNYQYLSVKMVFKIWEEGNSPWRDLAIDLPRSRIHVGAKIQIFHINARHIEAAFGAIANKPIVWINTYSVWPKIIYLTWLNWRQAPCNLVILLLAVTYRQLKNYSMCTVLLRLTQ